MPALVMGIVGLTAVLVGVVYFAFTTQRIYEDSMAHLGEIYGQINRSFGEFIERNWGLLESWGDYFALAGDEDEGAADAYLAKEKDYWGFSGLFFLSADGVCMNISGEQFEMSMTDVWTNLTVSHSPVMTGATFVDGREFTAFAVPVQHSAYKGFEYDALAVCYTNEDLANTLKVDAFSGQARCFVVHSDGSVLFSTQAGGNVYADYLAYLRGASDLSEEALARLENDWRSGISGVLQCRIGDTRYCCLYQSVGYQDYVMLSVVPMSAVSAGFLSVQRTTVVVVTVIFLILGSIAVVPVLQSSRRRSRQSYMELQYRERMFDVLSNSVDDIFMMLNSENQSVDYISPNIERLLGVPAQEARRNIRVMEKCAVNYDVVIPKMELAAIPLNGNRYWECEYMHQTTGERRWYRMTVYHMSIQGVEKYIIVLSDRTVEQQMNQKLQEALTAAQSANEAKSNFLSNMSHDIRTPMNAIVGFSVLLERDANDPEKVREYTRKISASSQHLLSLINDVLDMSKIESGKTSLNVDRFSLPELLEELNIILSPQAKAKKQSFAIRVQGTPPEEMMGDKLRLNQILINLLSNAVKYTPDGGDIEFTVRELAQASPQYTKLRFTVRDNGIGMSEEFQKHVFAPFSREISSVTNKIQGTGLGMAITKNLVDLMGGIIKVESQPGKGSTFTVEMSFVLPEQQESDVWFRQKVSRMLVADDETDVCLNIQEMMHGTGVSVSFVTNGADAVEMAAGAHKRGEDFDVILLDWKMPGMDGVETARRIRETVCESVPILVLTSYDWTDIEEQAREAGINAFMPKPFFVSTFWQTIKPLFMEQDAASASAPDPNLRVMEGCLFLVAEDNELNSEILTEMLALEGASCELAPDGEQAVEMFERSEPGYYDMILMDVQMPVMNGYEATRRIRASSHPEARTIPIVAMTANTFAEDVRNALDAGMNGHLAKPINMNDVRALVGRLLSERREAEDRAQ